MPETLSQPAGRTATDADLVARATDLRELLRKEAAVGDEQRNITDTAVAALRDAGMFRLGTPRRWGGHQAGMRTTLQVLAELGRGDAAASWVTMIYAVTNLAASLNTDRAQEEIWGDNPDAAVAGTSNFMGSTAVRVDGGYVVNGKWPFNSGCLHADWTMTPFPMFAEDGSLAGVRFGLVPYTDLTIEDTWHIAGMRGTGSNTAVGTDVFVPDHRIIEFDRIVSGGSRSEHPEAREIPGSVQIAMILGLMGPLLGAGQAAVDLAREAIDKGRPVVGSLYQKAAESPSYQLNYATAVSRLDTAFLHVLRAADDVDRSVGTEPPDDVTRGRVRMDIAVALQSLREAVTLSMSIGGAGSFATVNPANQVWRDFETGARHAILNPGIGAETYARALLGLEPIAVF
ncbi:acyl-CoA dehydrogenase family protein [Streptomyces sp. NPDC013157]|uniref:acyl-CoA dehydrogenase family protein n=1 Tax=Streptomyces sp. NPDC013157 TaxID=3364861 RepID=UPI0036C63AFA